jgi:hypothetical protein
VRNTPFDFLCAHAQKKYTAMDWAELLGVLILDADGWESREEMLQPIDLREFMRRIMRCTIMQRS